jgi:multiple sugar transport system substrate-binding protein
VISGSTRRARGLAVGPILAACGGTTPTATTAPTARPSAAASAAGAPSAASSAVASAAPSTAAAVSCAPSAASAGPATPSTGATYKVPTIPPGNHTLKILQWSHFVPAYDNEYFDKYAVEWGKKNNVEVTVDHLQTDTVVTRVAAEVAANSGHDLTQVETATDVPVFAEKTVDMTPLGNYLGETHGGWLPVAEQVAKINGVWKGIPDFYISFPGIYRKDYYDGAGLQPSETWDDLLKAGTALKAKGNPAGIAISACGDSNTSILALMACFGSSVTAKDGKTITINSPETKQAIEFMQKLYKDAMTPEVLSWDNAGNNRFLASGIGSWIHNPISAYRSLEKPIQEKSYISGPPGGPKNRVMIIPLRTYLTWQWTKEKEVAEKFLHDFFAQYTEAQKASTGYNHPLLKQFEKKPMPGIGEEAKLNILQDVGQYAGTIGWPGPVTKAAGEVFNAYIIPTMFQQVMQGTAIDKAIADAETKVKLIYEKNPPA